MKAGTDGALGTSRLNSLGGRYESLNGLRKISNEIDFISLSSRPLFTVTGPNNTILTGKISGAGGLIKEGTGELTINNVNNSYSKGTDIKQGVLSIADDHALGMSDGTLSFGGIDNATTLPTYGTLRTTADISSSRATTLIKGGGVFDIAASTTLTFDGLISGSGSLSKAGLGILKLSAENTYTGDTEVTQGTLAISKDENLGAASNQTILNGGDLKITADVDSKRMLALRKSSNVIIDPNVTAVMSGWRDSGVDSNTFNKLGDGTLIWAGDNSLNKASVNVSNGTLQIGGMDNLASSDATVNMEKHGTLSIFQNSQQASDVQFASQLSGSGTLNVGLGGNNVFSFASSATGGNFTGTLAMNNGRLRLNSDTDSILANTSVELNGGNSKLGVIKLDGEHSVGALILNGGRLEVDYSGSDNRPKGLLEVSRFDATGGGSVAINPPSSLPNPIAPTGASLFDQDDQVYDQIIKAAKIQGDGTQLDLLQMDGTSIGKDTTVSLIRNGVKVGSANYNYLGAVKSDGLYLGYGLTKLAALSGQSIILDNANAIDNKLGAIFSGDGGFTINATDRVYIGNAANNYTGDTYIDNGDIELVSDNSFGNTSALKMNKNSVVDFNENIQTVGHLYTNEGSRIKLNNGTLTVTKGGKVDGNFFGGGTLNLTGGILNLTQDSSLFTGNTNISNKATASLKKANSLGLGSISIQDNSNLILDDINGKLPNSLKSTGNVVVLNNANVELMGNNSAFSGNFIITPASILTAATAEQLGTANVDVKGTLVLDNAKQWTLNNNVKGVGSLVKRGDGTLQLNQNNVSVGLTSVENGTLIIGAQSDNSSTAILTSNVVVGKNANLGGYGKVSGNVENNGNLIVGDALLNAGYGNFTIAGDYTGNNESKIYFNTALKNDSSHTDKLNITGSTYGNSSVLVTNANGVGEQTENGIKLIHVGGRSEGKFSLRGRAIAGAYEYFLYRGGVNTPDDGDWYLRSSLTSTPGPYIYNPEAGSYIANIAAAGKLFNLQLEDREGYAETDGMWLRHVGSRTTHRDTSGHLRTTTKNSLTQGGKDLFSIPSGYTGRLDLGIMLARGQAISRTSAISAYIARSRIEGYSTGIYGTWYHDADTLNGAYLDSWVQYSRMKATVNGEQRAGESYLLDGISSSVEGGYRLPVWHGTGGDVFVTPQAQITRNGIRAEAFRDGNGTRIGSGGSSIIQTRLGVKVSREDVRKDKGAEKKFTVYAETNWLNNSRQPSAVLDSIEVEQAGSRNIGELKLGAEGKLNRNLSLWSNVKQQLGGAGYNHTALTIGVKYNF